MDLNDDLLQGAAAIGQFLGMNERQVFYLAERRQLPVFKVGSKWVARKSTLRAHIEKLEKEAVTEAGGGSAGGSS